MTIATALRAAALLAAALAANAAERPENFVQWREGLASSAQPKAEWLATAGEEKYEVLVNLAPPQSHGSLMNEGGIVGSKGVKYVNIPVDFMRPTAEDFRFTTKGQALYAFMMGWPGKQAVIPALSSSSSHAPGKIERITLLGQPAPLKFTRDASALKIDLPDNPPSDYAVAFHISGSGLV